MNEQKLSIHKNVVVAQSEHFQNASQTYHRRLQQK